MIVGVIVWQSYPGRDDQSIRHQQAIGIDQVVGTNDCRRWGILNSLGVIAGERRHMNNHRLALMGRFHCSFDATPNTQKLRGPHVDDLTGGSEDGCGNVRELGVEEDGLAVVDQKPDELVAFGVIDQFEPDLIQVMVQQSGHFDGFVGRLKIKGNENLSHVYSDL